MVESAKTGDQSPVIKDGEDRPYLQDPEPVSPDSGSDSSGNTIAKPESISKANISDQASHKDWLGFTPYVEAIAEFLTNDETQPPLTLSIEGEWGSGKTSFMKQLQKEIEQISKRNKKPVPKMVWFNAWRHDKVEALWAAFALEFLRQISTAHDRSELIPTWKGNLKLFWLRLNWRENWQELARVISLSLFLGSFALVLPALFVIVGVDGIHSLSEQIVCRLSPEGDEQGEEIDQESASAELQENIQNEARVDSPAASKLEQCLTLESESGNPSEMLLNILLLAGGVGGSATGVLALLAKVGEIIGDPKNDLKQYLESPDYEKQVAFIEKFHADFEKMVTAYAGKGNKVYVFIDDLDRCGLSKSADLMQGLNLLISNDPHLMFIVAMDREKIAAGIALKHEDVLPYLSSPSVVLDDATGTNRPALKGLEYGYAYVEKFVQLPFQIPKVSKENFEYFLAKLSVQETILEQTVFQGVASPLKSLGRKCSQLLPRSMKYFFTVLQEKFPQSLKALESFSGESGSKEEEPTQKSPLYERRETLKLEGTGDSETVRQIILSIAPALDYNPRRIKQFVNLFRLKVFIASNTGLFDEIKSLSKVSDSTKSNYVSRPLTLEQLGKFTALCLKYPLLGLDVENDNRLLERLQRYALERRPGSKNFSEQTDEHKRTLQEEYGITTLYWGSNPELIQLLQAGCYSDQKQKDPSDVLEIEKWSLEKVDVKKLLQVSPQVDPIDRVPLWSERSVDYRSLRDLLRGKHWKEADRETLKVMLKAAQLREKELLYFEHIEEFPCQDLQTIDQLWVQASDGKFGFSVQKKIYIRCGAKLNGLYPGTSIWKEFLDRIGWLDSQKRYLDYEELQWYVADVTEGHLPLPLALGWGKLWAVKRKSPQSHSPEKPGLFETLLSRSDL